VNRFIAIIFLVLLMAGCAAQTSESGYRQMLEAYHGRHIDHLVSAWGAPQNVYAYKDGNKEYYFLRTRQGTPVDYAQPFDVGLAGIGLAGGGGRGLMGGIGFNVGRFGQATPVVCETRVITDAKGFITDYKYRGNGCRSKSD
jgi:hypothetical protein